MNEFTTKHADYVACEVEQVILSEAAIRYTGLALDHFNKDNLTREIVGGDVTEYINSNCELVDLLPPDFPVAMLRQKLIGTVLWTVTVTRKAGLTTTLNSTAGRSSSRNHAAMAAIIRAYANEVIS